MIAWLIFGAYVLGWLLSIRGSLHRRMLAEVCVHCGHDHVGRREDHHGNCYRSEASLPRGAVRERNGRDVAVAIWAAAWWPIRLLFVAIYRTVAALGGGIKTAVLHATPLTTPELERRLREQEAEIKRLTSEMEATS